MEHSFSNNMHRDLRVIQNPNVRLKEPFRFDRDKRDDYSIVELTTMHQLGVDRLQGWRLTGRREFISKEQRWW